MFGDFRDVANSVKIEPTQKIPDIRYVNTPKLNDEGNIVFPFFLLLSNLILT